MMISRLFRTFAAFVFGALLIAGTQAAQAQNAGASGPYGGTVVEDIIARVNDQVITVSDYQRALDELNQEAQQRGDSMQQTAEARRDLLRNLIDQQLWLSKGKELGITGDTELIQRLDEIRKQYHLASMEDLETAAKQQGVSFEDFKANIRNGIITQDVMGREVGAHIQITPGEAMRYYDAHKQEFEQQESVQLSEILVSAEDTSDPAKLAAAKAKAVDIEARLHSGGDFTQLARSFSDGPTAASGGDLGQFRRGGLAKELEDKTFALNAGQYTDPILTRQGYIILKVVQHTPGGVSPFKDVEPQVEQAIYMTRMEPAIRAYLTKLREEAFIDIKAGYEDTGASPNESKPVFSAYVPPSPKKKQKVERTRYRESTRTFRQKAPQTAAPVEQAAPPVEQPAAPVAQAPAPAKHKWLPLPRRKEKGETTQAAGKREKIRFGRAPRETLPTAANTTGTENAGALPENPAAPQETAANVPAPVPGEEAAQAARKTRYTYRAREAKKHKAKSGQPQVDALAPPPPTTAEVADQQTQSAPLGLNGDTASKKKKRKVDTGEKSRLTDEKKTPKPPPQPLVITPAAPVPGAPAPLPPPQQ